MDVDEIAERLYGLPPDEFTAARDAAAKSADDAATGKAVKALRKPTAGAHAVNALVRSDREQIDRLLALGDEMREAMRGDPAEVRRLTEERRALIQRLLGPEATATVQQDVTATLEAATADPELGAAVRSGRLVKALRYAGFGTMPDLDDALATPLRLLRGSAAPKKPPAAKKVATKEPSPTLAAARERCLDLAGKADDAQRRYDLAVKAATEARRVLDEAESERADAHKAARAAHAEAERARREVGRLERS